MDIDKTTRLLSEGIARSTSRRDFLRKAGQTAFFALASLASGHMLRGNASAEPQPTDPRKAPKTTKPTGSQPACNPPGPYCNRGTGDLSGCRGGHCHSHLVNGKLIGCELDYQFYPGVGCWSTRVSNGYWLCCDCRCRTDSGGYATCGCAQFSSTPIRGIDGSTPGK